MLKDNLDLEDFNIKKIQELWYQNGHKNNLEI